MTQAKIIGEKILKRTPYGVRIEGTDVIMTLGDKAARMDWETAIRLGTFLRYAGKKAKSKAGAGMLWTVVADLTDANADEMQAQISRDGTAVFKRQ